PAPTPFRSFSRPSAPDQPPNGLGNYIIVIATFGVLGFLNGAKRKDVRLNNISNQPYSLQSKPATAALFDKTLA
ncbi:hypothetical protein, partial [Lichenifustis flavocetrariae]